ncbi:uncharacterized protein LTR77_010188 [Saxophila tyrrhenica]|uniref:WW domain-containing protein n=1 Tax=Saxophila tyrrhenica TaxID=1690608 RepID=A0AAV9NYX9_9PEZI|nr:hypothetical protein LTR77_010188 [Saxophila tyrrhenica]
MDGEGPVDIAISMRDSVLAGQKRKHEDIHEDIVDTQSPSSYAASTPETTAYPVFPSEAPVLPPPHYGPGPPDPEFPSEIPVMPPPHPRYGKAVGMGWDGRYRRYYYVYATGNMIWSEVITTPAPAGHPLEFPAVRRTPEESPFRSENNRSWNDANYQDNNVALTPRPTYAPHSARQAMVSQGTTSGNDGQRSGKKAKTEHEESEAMDVEFGEDAGAYESPESAVMDLAKAAAEEAAEAAEKAAMEETIREMQEDADELKMQSYGGLDV